MRAVTDRASAGATRAPVAVAAPLERSYGRVCMGAAAAAGVAVYGASLALSTRTGMWLDEAQTVAIARMEISDLLEALRSDGSPPLYYLLLHGWMALVGTGDLAARSLSAVFAVGAVALAPLAGLRLGGRRLAVAAAALFATSPFIHRYATEARMYTLVVLLAVAGFLALHAALGRPTPVNLVAVGTLTGLLLLTHYWSLFLLATVAAVLVVGAVRSRRNEGMRGGTTAAPVLAAMAAGTLLFLPWVPTFLFQARHTGAPWGAPAGAWMFENTLQAFVGGQGRLGALGFLIAGLLVLGLFGRALPGGRIELGIAGHPHALPLALTIAGTLCLALVVSQLIGSAFAPRYAAVVLVPFLLLAALGLCVVEHRAALALVATAVVGIGLVRSADQAGAPRTQARQLAGVLDERAQPGDLLAFCPDQLAPAVLRLVSVAVSPVVYPPGSPGSRVDWVDYRDRVKATPGREFARSLDHRAGGSTVWLALAPGYHSLGKSCERVLQGMRALRPGGTRVLAQQYSHFERASLWRFPFTPNP